MSYIKLKLINKIHFIKSNNNNNFQSYREIFHLSIIKYPTNTIIPKTHNNFPIS
jgi:hypothetical protein